MADMEKVIGDLDGLTWDDWHEWHSDSEVRQIAKDAIELLKEQDAVPVTKRETACMFFWCCGSCGVAITEGDKFCRMCGKEVKWNA